VDAEMKLVVVADDCIGECLVQASRKHGVTDVRNECVCMWEDLGPDEETPAK
jgi:hypothetical protein